MPSDRPTGRVATVISDVTVLGVGAMGAAIVRALFQGGYAVTAWNRTAGKLKTIETLGVASVSSCATAVRSSPVVVVCVSDYDAFHEILGRPDVAPVVDDRVIVNLSTGTPAETRLAEDMIRELGGAYLDGAILVYPATVGTATAQILVAGPEDAFEVAAPALRCLGGDLRFLGPNIVAASALDLAYLSRLMAVVFGTVHGAHICESEGVAVDQLAALYPPGDRARTVAQAIHDDSFEVSPLGATARVSRGALLRLHEQGRSRGINSALPDLMLDLLDRAIAAGYGDQETAALIKILRGTNTN